MWYIKNEVIFIKILVFSDSHGRVSNIIEAIEKHPNCSLVIFLGDGLRDIVHAEDKFPNITFFKVKGNCDLVAGDTPKEAILDLDGIKVLITHGDKYHVKYGLATILYAGAEKEVDAILFGHTHLPVELCEYVADKRIQLFNPGSIGACGTYGVINTANGILVTNIAKLYPEKP